MAASWQSLLQFMAYHYKGFLRICATHVVRLFDRVGQAARLLSGNAFLQLGIKAEKTLIVSGHLGYVSLREIIPCHTDTYLSDGVEHLQGINIPAYAKNVDLGEKILRFFL